MTLGIGLLLPGGLQGGAVALLVGSCAAGAWTLGIEGHRPRALGFHLSPGALGESAKGIALGAAIGAAVVALMAVAGGVRWIGDDGDIGSWVLVGLGALGYLAIPAAAEEALLRGYPLQALAEAWGAGAAIVVTSVAFGLLHLANPGATPLSLANIAGAGVLLGVVYVRTASLWWASGVHLGWNWSHGFLADVPVSGLEVLDAPLYDGVTAGATWVGGGSFGPEGSVVATIVLLVASVTLWFGPWLRPGDAMRSAPPLHGLGPAPARSGVDG